VFLSLAASAAVAQQPNPTNPPPTKYQFYKSLSSPAVIVFVETPHWDKYFKEWDYDRDQYFSEDGATFNKIRSGSSYGHDGIDETDFTVVATNKEGKWVHNKNKRTLTIDGKAFRSVNLNPANLRFLEFPVVRYARVLLKTDGGEYVLVTDNRNAENYNEVKLFVGPAGSLREVKIKDHSFTRCGAFWLMTAEGTLAYHTADVEQSEPAT